MKRPLLHTGPLAAMAEEILAHADNVMRAAKAKQHYSDFWDAYVAATLSGLPPWLNSIQRKLANRLTPTADGAGLIYMPSRRIGLAHAKRVLTTWQAKYEPGRS